MRRGAGQAHQLFFDHRVKALSDRMRYYLHSDISDLNHS